MYLCAPYPNSQWHCKRKARRDNVYSWHVLYLKYYPFFQKQISKRAYGQKNCLSFMVKGASIKRIGILRFLWSTAPICFQPPLSILALPLGGWGGGPKRLYSPPSPITTWLPLHVSHPTAYPTYRLLPHPKAIFSLIPLLCPYPTPPPLLSHHVSLPLAN